MARRLPSRLRNRNIDPRKADLGRAGTALRRVTASASPLRTTNKETSGEVNDGISLNLKDKPGHCRICGAPFMGPGNRKFCEEHSPSIKYRGRG
jgi:hypothetical protein